MKKQPHGAELWELPCLSILKARPLERWRKCGITKLMFDRRIGKKCLLISGPVSSSNYVECPDPSTSHPRDAAPIGAIGNFVYIQFRPLPRKMVLFHLDFQTASGQPLRISCSSMFSSPIKLVGRALRVPLRPDSEGRWTVVGLDVGALLEMFTHEGHGMLKGIKLCANMVVRDIFTSHGAFTPASLPAEMQLPAGPDAWHETYSWVWYPHTPSTHPTHSAVSGRSPPRVQVEVSATVSRALRPAATPSSRAQTPRRPTPQSTSLSRSKGIKFELERVIGFRGERCGTMAWAGGPEQTVVAFPCNNLIVLMNQERSETGAGDATDQASGADQFRSLQQSFLMGHTAEVKLVEVSNSGRLLVSAEVGETGRVCLWEVQDHRRGWVCDLKGHTSHVTALSFSADDKLICSVGRDVQHRVQILVWSVQALRAGEGNPGPGNTNAALVARQTSDFPINRIKFSPVDHNVKPPSHPVPDISFRRRGDVTLAQLHNPSRIWFHVDAKTFASGE